MAARPDDDVSRRALAAERLRSSRLIGRIRFIGISVTFVFNWLLPHLFANAGAYQGPVGIFLVYWLGAAAFYLAGRRSERVANLVGLDIPVFDMPAVFILLTNAASWPNLVSAILAITYFSLLTVAASFALEGHRIVLAAATGTVLELALLWQAGAEAVLMVTVALVMFGVAVSSLYITARTIELVRVVAEEQRRRERLGRYFSPQVAARVESLADGAAAGENRIVTVLFADLRDFTALSDALTSERVVGILNDFHTRMVEAVFAHGGTLDKYLGDGLMAYFGAPVPSGDHPLRGVRCALAMQDGLRAMNARRAALGEAPLRMGIGVHTGPVVLGDIGAPNRREYTAIGDTVNVAARIEQLTKVHQVPILVSDATRTLVGAALAFEAAAPLAVKGKPDPLRCHAPVCRERSPSAG
jgi:adenylate cyclase